MANQIAKLLLTREYLEALREASLELGYQINELGTDNQNLNIVELEVPDAAVSFSVGCYVGVHLKNSDEHGE